MDNFKLDTFAHMLNNSLARRNKWSKGVRNEIEMELLAILALLVMLVGGCQVGFQLWRGADFEGCIKTTIATQPDGELTAIAECGEFRGDYSPADFFSEQFTRREK